MRRIAEQVETDIVQGELGRADEALTEAVAHWPATRDFADDGRLRIALEEALETARSPAGSRGTRRRRRVSADPRPGSWRRDKRGARHAPPVAWTSTPATPRRGPVPGRHPSGCQDRDPQSVGIRENTQRASQLLDAVEGEWGGDSELARLRSEVDRQFAELDKALEIRRLLALAEQRLGADRLTLARGRKRGPTISRRVLALDADNVAGGAGGSRGIGDRYVVLIGEAIETGRLPQGAGNARQFSGALSPEHPQLPPLRGRIEAGESVVVAQETAEPSGRRGGTAGAGFGETGGRRACRGPHGRRRSIVVRGQGTVCVEADIRRYMESYPRRPVHRRRVAQDLILPGVPVIGRRSI